MGMQVRLSPYDCAMARGGAGCVLYSPRPGSLAETGGATSVNFDEVAVYCNEAILPRYLVVYKYDPAQ